MRLFSLSGSAESQLSNSMISIPPFFIAMYLYNLLFLKNVPECPFTYWYQCALMGNLHQLINLHGGGGEGTRPCGRMEIMCKCCICKIIQVYFKQSDGRCHHQCDQQALCPQCHHFRRHQSLSKRGAALCFSLHFLTHLPLRTLLPTYKTWWTSIHHPLQNSTHSIFPGQSWSQSQPTLPLFSPKSQPSPEQLKTHFALQRQSCNFTLALEQLLTWNINFISLSTNAVCPNYLPHFVVFFAALYERQYPQTMSKDIHGLF